MKKQSRIFQHCKAVPGRILSLLRPHLLLFFLAMFLTFLVSVIAALRKEGLDVYASQRNVLKLEVFAKTDLKPEWIPLLEESLRSMPGIKRVVSFSPENAIQKLTSDPQLDVDGSWLLQKTEELKGKDTILPWTYNLYLKSWDQTALNELTQKIQELEIGVPQTKAVTEVHYDQERWVLAVSLFNYLKWLKGVLWVCILFGLGFLSVLIKKWIGLDDSQKIIFIKSGYLPMAGLGILSGFLLHLLCVYVFL